MRVFRTHDGHSFDVGQKLSAYRSRNDLFDVIGRTSGIPVDDLICMTRSGQQLTDELLDQLQEDEERGPSSSRHDVHVEVFVFNRQYLYADLEPLVHEMEEDVTLEDAVDEPQLVHPPTPKALDYLLEWCAMLLHNMTQHHSRAEQCLAQLQTIDEGTRVALSNLLSHAESVKVGADELQASAGKELERMQGLLAGHQTDLRILSMVQINPKLLPENGRNRPKERYLADYVSPSKMGAVFQACSNVHSELQGSLVMLRSNGEQLWEDTEGLRVEVDSTNVDPSNETLQESSQALVRALELQAFLRANCAPDEQGWPAAERLTKDESLLRTVDDAAGELVLLDEVCRESLRRLSADKNDMMLRSLHLLSDISSLQSEFADLGIELSQLDAEFKSTRTDGFRHLLRLKNMLFAYGSTLIEIFRRKEFGKEFLGRSQALAELMASFSEGERRKRLTFSQQVAGALPWEIKGLEESTPNLEISTGPSIRDVNLTIDRSEIQDLFKTLDDIEASLQHQEHATSVRQVRDALQESFGQVEEAEAEFIRLVELTFLDSRDESERGEDEEGEDTDRRPSVNPRKLLQDRAKLQKELQDLKMAHGERERALAQMHDDEMTTLRAELNKLKTDLRIAEHSLEQERVQHVEIKHALDTVRAEADTESARRLNMHEELSRLRQEVEDARKSEKEAKREANEEGERAHELESHHRDLQAELEEVKRAHSDASKRVEALLSKGTSFEGELHVAQERIDELTKTLSEARSEAREARDALSEAEVARDKALRTYRAEADGDRAILEESLRSKTIDLDEIQAIVKHKEVELAEHLENIKNLQSQLTAADSAHEQLVQQLEQAREASIDAEHAKRQGERSMLALVDKLRIHLSKTILLSDALKRVPALSGHTTKSGSKLVAETANVLNEKEEAERQEAFDKFTAGGEGASLDSIFGILTWSAKAPIEEAAVSKLETLTTLCKKWMKAYKHTNEKGQRQLLSLREKITFRNFAVGDLALFLPTRSSIPPPEGIVGHEGTAINFSKPWAAFNINFPHFFLNFNGKPENEQLRDSLRQKEWIVARITNIESRIASSNGPETNPFQLADGVKYYLLDVENWNLANAVQAPPNTRRKSTSTANVLNERKDVPPPPPLRRWESTPDAAHERSTTSEDKALGQLNEEEKERAGPVTGEEEKGDSPTPAGKSDESPPPIESAKVLTTEALPSSAPSTLTSMPSGLALSLKQLPSSPESARNGRSSKGNVNAPELSQPGETQTGSLSRWSSAASQTTGSSVTSERYLHRMTNSAAPAFGRSKRLMGPSNGNGQLALGRRNEGNGSFPPAERQQGIGSDEPSHRSEKVGAGAVPILLAKKRKEEESTPNPFSASPAPGGLMSEQTALGSLRERKTSLLRDAATADQVLQQQDKGKGRESEGDAIAEATESSSSKQGQRPPSQASRASSRSSRGLALNIRSRPTAIGSPRVRASPAVLKPTMETAQGLNSFGHAAYASDGGVGSSSSVVNSPEYAQRSLSGFSLRSAGSPSIGDHSSSSGGMSGVVPVNGERDVGELHAQQRTMSSSNSRASVNTTSPSMSSNKRRSSLFGSWTMGRRAGMQTVHAHPIRSSSSSSSVLINEEDADDGGEGGTDLSATITDARQSLRRLTRKS